MKKMENKSKWFIGSGIVAAFGASLCCIGPLLLTVLGISGAASLTQFESIRIPMIVIVFFAFSVAGLALFKKRAVCEPDSICADPMKYKRMVLFYWLGLLIAILGITSPYWINFFYD